MSVYVDNMQADFGRMKMCHMAADSREELLAMAAKIGVQAKWLQKAGTVYEHFDICLSKRALAVRHGAKEISMRDFGKLIHTKRAGGGEGPMTTTPDRGARDRTKRLRKALWDCKERIQHAPHTRTGKGGIVEHDPRNCTRCKAEAVLDSLPKGGRMTAYDFLNSLEGSGRFDFASMKSWTLAQCLLVFEFAERYHYAELQNEQKARDAGGNAQNAQVV